MEEKNGELKIVKKESDWFFDDLSADLKAGLNQWREVEKKGYWYGLEVLPPIECGGGAFMVSEPHSDIFDGERYVDTIHSGFVQIEEQYFARYVGRKAFRDEVAKLRAAVRKEQACQGLTRELQTRNEHFYKYHYASESHIAQDAGCFPSSEILEVSPTPEYLQELAKRGARGLTCCVCEESAGRHHQHWNRDTGYGICPRCARKQKAEISEEEMKSLYGIEEVNYSLEDPPATPTL